MDVGLNQHFACMFAIFVAILVLREKTCYRLFQTELHWTDLSFELGEGWVGYGITAPSSPAPLVPFSMPSIRGPRTAQWLR